MSRHQLESIEAKRARHIGLGVFIGGTVLTVFSLFETVSTPPNSSVLCSKPAAIEICAPSHTDEAAWIHVLEWGGALTVAGSVTFLSANALDRKLLALRYARQVDHEVRFSSTSDVETYMAGLPTPPPDIVPPK